MMNKATTVGAICSQKRRERKKNDLEYKEKERECEKREKKREKERMKQRHFVAAVITLVDRE